jgi:glutaredoxin 2
MTTVSYSDTQVGSFAQKILGIKLLEDSKFAKLRNMVEDNLDQVEVIYPEGECSLDVENFVEKQKNQTNEKQTYSVSVPVNLIEYAQGQIRLIQPSFCEENFANYKFKVNFQESETPVFIFNEKTGRFQVTKKQHTTMQALAIASAVNPNMTIRGRVVAFNSNVNQEVRDLEASNIFYREVKSINTTKDWEKLEHRCQLHEESALRTRSFYLSIPGLTWQPVSHAYPLVQNSKCTITKVREMERLVGWATNDDRLDVLKEIVESLSTEINWDKESESKEISSYLVKALYNFDKIMVPIYEEKTGETFDTIEFIRWYFKNKVRKQSMVIGSTKDTKGAWLQVLQVCNRVNNYMTSEGFVEEAFFTSKNKSFVQSVINLCNANRKKGNLTPEKEIKGQITARCDSF